MSSTSVIHSCRPSYPCPSAGAITRWAEEVQQAINEPPARHRRTLWSTSPEEDFINPPPPITEQRSLSRHSPVTRLKTHEDFFKTPKPNFDSLRKNLVTQNDVTYIVSRRKAYVISFNLTKGTLFREDIEAAHNTMTEIVGGTSVLFKVLRDFRSDPEACKLTARLGRKRDKWEPRLQALELAMATIAQAEASGHAPVFYDVSQPGGYLVNAAKVERGPLDLALQITKHKKAKWRSNQVYPGLAEALELVARAEAAAARLAPAWARMASIDALNTRHEHNVQDNDGPSLIRRVSHLARWRSL